MRQGQSMHSTLDQVKHTGFHPLGTIMSYTMKIQCSIQLSRNRHVMVHDWHKEGYESMEVIAGSFKNPSVS